MMYRVHGYMLDLSAESERACGAKWLDPEELLKALVTSSEWSELKQGKSANVSLLGRDVTVKVTPLWMRFGIDVTFT